MHYKKQKFITLTLLISIFYFTNKTAAEETKWKRDISLGYNQTSGNTQNKQFTLFGSAIRSFHDAEFSIKGSSYYSSSNQTMVAQKWDGQLRYSFDFTESKNWFNSYQFKIEHDRFADINYRMLPSTGIGYWFSKTDEFKLMFETSAGYEITKFWSNKEDNQEPALILHGFTKKLIFKKDYLSEDISIIPSLNNGGTRMTANTIFTNPIANGLALNIKFVLEHNTKPSSEDIKKTDSKFITELKYSF